MAIRWRSKALKRGTPGPGLEGAGFLADFRPRAIGSDTIPLERIPPDEAVPSLPVHRLLLVDRGIHIIEILNLEEIARKEGERVFTFFLSPLKIVGATGAPARPLAIRSKAYDMTEALSGLRVIDASNSVAGQFCGRLFADNGAAVVLVGAPGGSRTDVPVRSRPMARSTLFAHLNKGKASLLVGGDRPSHDRLTHLAECAECLIVDSDTRAPYAFGTAEVRARSASSRLSDRGRWRGGRAASSSIRR